MQNGGNQQETEHNWCLNVKMKTQFSRVPQRLHAKNKNNAEPWFSKKKMPHAMAKNMHNNAQAPVSKHRAKTRGPETAEQWGWFLAGLIDSDGHFNKLGYRVIAFDLSNADCAYDVKKVVGHGRVSPVNHKKAYTYVLSHGKGLAWVAGHLE